MEQPLPVRLLGVDPLLALLVICPYLRVGIGLLLFFVGPGLMLRLRHHQILIQILQSYILHIFGFSDFLLPGLNKIAVIHMVVLHSFTGPTVSLTVAAAILTITEPPRRPGLLLACHLGLGDGG